jgi:hypothetical protein
MHRDLQKDAGRALWQQPASRGSLAGAAVLVLHLALIHEEGADVPCN